MQKKPQLTSAVLSFGLLLTLNLVSFCIAESTATWLDLKLPSNGTITALQYSNQILFAGLKSGRIYRSLDDGLSWSQVLENTGGSIQKFLFTDSVYLATSMDYGPHGCIPDACEINSGGLFRSSDLGQTWAAIKPVDLSGLVIAGKSIYGGTFGAIYKSDEKALAWKPQILKFETGEDFRFTGMPSLLSLEWFHNNLYFTVKHQLYRAIPKGDTLRIQARVMDTVSAMLSVPPYLITSGPGLTRRTKDGINWENLNTFEFKVLSMAGKQIAGINVDGKKIMQSADTAKTWISQPMPQGRPISLGGNEKSLVVGFENSGVQTLFNRVEPWVSGGPGLHDLPSYVVGFDQGDLIVEVNHIGVSKIPITQMTDNHKWDIPKLDWITSCFGCPQTLLGDGWRTTFDSRNSLILCTQTGSCETIKTTGLPFPFTFRTTYDYPEINRMRSGAINGDTLIVAGDTLYRSIDRGVTWQKIRAPLGSNQIIAYESGTWYLGALEYSRTTGQPPLFTLWSSNDVGLNWSKQLSESLPTVHAMTVRNHVVFLASDSGIYLAKPGSSRFQALGTKNAGSENTSVAISGTLMVAGFRNGRVMALDLTETGTIAIKGNVKSSHKVISRIKNGIYISGGVWRLINGRGIAKPKI